MASKRVEFFNGNSGEVWIAGTKIGTISKGKIVKKQNYEEIPALEGDGRIRVPSDSTIEVSMSYRPTGEYWSVDMFNLEEDVTVIMANTNIVSGAKRRVKCISVTFDEQSLINFEKHKIEEIELNGQAEKIEILE